MRRHPIARATDGRTRLLTGVLIGVIATVSCLLAIELAARGYDTLRPSPPDRESFLRDTPAPYADADFLGPDFIAELITLNPLVNAAADQRLTLPDFTGRYFNLENGRRVTTGSPKQASRTVHVFGGSTVFGIEVPDWHTIPSRLQLHLARRLTDRVRVENHGVPGYTVQDQTEQLRRTALNADDVVVFYDGTNEVSHLIYYGYAARDIATPPETTEESWSAAERATRLLWRHLHRHSTFASRFLDVETNQRWSVPPHLSDPGKRAIVVERARSAFRSGLLGAIAYSGENGSEFLHFLQPTIFTQVPPSDYEKRLIDNHNIVFAGLDIAHRQGYAALREVLAELRHQLDSVDLSAALRDRREGLEFFIDDCHVTHEANDIIAEKIAGEIIGLLGET